MSVKDTQAKRLSPARLAKAKNAATTLTDMPDYNPQRKEYEASIAAALEASLDKSSKAELKAQQVLDAARDKAAADEWALYNFMLGAAEQVAGQYGSNSDEFASLGYKKKSEYKKSGSAKKTGTA